MTDVAAPGRSCSWTSARHICMPPMPDEEFAELSPETWKDGQCAMLIYTVWRMRAATGNWEKEHSGTLEEVGFRSRRATVVAFLPRRMRHQDHLTQGRLRGRGNAGAFGVGRSSGREISVESDRDRARLSSTTRRAPSSWEGLLISAAMSSDGRLTRRSWRCVEWFRGTRQCWEPKFK